MVALGLYLATFIAIIGSVTYFVVESPVRAKLQQNLNLRAEILSSLIEAPLNSSESFLHSLVGLAQAQPDSKLLARHFKSILATSDDTIISAGIWPEPYVYEADRERDSYF
ncbi:histidine kinase, partial [Vibrio fortis]